MTKLCIDFGSGYNPKAGYKTCDITTFPQLDFQYDGKDEIVGLREKSVDVFYLRNVVHHIPDLQRTFTKEFVDNMAFKISEELGNEFNTDPLLKVTIQQ